MTVRNNCKTIRITSIGLCAACLFALAGGLFSTGLAGAVAGDTEPAAEAFPRTAETYWAYRTVSRPGIPSVRNTDHVATPVDAFLLARLEPLRLGFTAPASRRALIRRATLDLWGLPPTPEETAAFEADTAPDAYGRLLDRLLAHTRYGERWGRMWLDVVRYADTAGYNADPVRPQAYQYRDYVIRSFHTDKPYNRFVQEQLAGDELFPDSPEAIIATGYLRLPPDESNASNVLLARQDMLNDITANVGVTFLAQSFGCAQCHDHKFDLITQRDFFRLQAYFAGVIPVDEHPVGTPAELRAWREKFDAWKARAADVQSELHTLETELRKKVGLVKRMKFPSEVLRAIDTPPEERTAMQNQLCFFAERQIVIKESELEAAMTDEQKTNWTELKAKRAKLNAERPAPPRTLNVMAGVDGRETPPTHLLLNGTYNKPTARLLPGVPSMLVADGKEHDAVIEPPHSAAVGRRSTLAHWLTRADHPLTARVMVNRIWQGHFGVGLVENANDFGTQTPNPHLPELLDWLAAEFVAPTWGDNTPAHSATEGAATEDGSKTGRNQVAWGIKRMHRLIMQSAAYQQGALRYTANAKPPQGLTADPDNDYYWHFPRRRLDAEQVRDTLLFVSGLLVEKPFGPGVQPELPRGYNSREAWTVSADEKDRRRRSVYILAKRNLPYPLLSAFDLPDSNESCARRAQTTTAPQSLMLLQSELVLGFAESFAEKVLAGRSAGELETIVTDIWRHAYNREPTSGERSRAIAFVEQQEAVVLKRLSDQTEIRLAHPEKLPPGLSRPFAAAITDLCHAVLNSNELLFVE